MLRYVVRMAIGTAVFSTLFAFLFGYPHWYWNPLIGLAVGAVAGVVLWKPSQALLDWLDRNEGSES